MHSRGTRLARGWAIGVFATAVAAMSHGMAGGGGPSWLALATGVVFGGMLGTLAVDWRPSLPRLTIAVGGTQLAFHAVFSLLGTSGSVAVAGQHQHGPIVVSTLGSTHGSAHVDGPLMWLGHAVAGAITLALLQGAERAAWRLLSELARLVVKSFRVQRPTAVPVAVRRVPGADSSPAISVAWIFSTSAPRRGPPAAVAL